jgi:glycosyltransferase involved in cell wall biosynthesis
MHIVIVATHPIQYQAPLYRLLHAREGVNLTALFLSEHSVKGGLDKGFGQSVQWDVPLLEGYDSIFLMNEGAGCYGSGFRAYRFGGFDKVFKKLRPNVVFLHGHFVQAYWQALFAATRLRIPVVTRPDSLEGTGKKRSPPKQMLQRAVTRLFYRNTSAFCWSGHFSRQDAYRYGFDDVQLFFSPHCIDTELFKRLHSEAVGGRESLRKCLGIGSDQVAVIFVGKFIDWKNPSLLLKAIESLSPTDRDQIFMLMVGSGPDLERVRAYAKSIKGLKYLFPGFANQSELARYYTAADCAVFPSKKGHESWGLVVNEAMTCGLPVSVSDGVGSRVDLVKDGVTGFVFEDGKHLQLADILLRWLADRKMLKTMGDAAKEHVESYSSHKAAEGIHRACVWTVSKSKGSSR